MRILKAILLFPIRLVLLPVRLLILVALGAGLGIWGAINLLAKQLT